MNKTDLLNVCSGQGSDAGSGGNLPVVATGDVEKRLREEEAGEVRHDVAHVDKRSKKMVSSVQLHLQAAGLGPTKPVSVISSRDESKESLPPPAQGDSSPYSGNVAEIYHPAPITNSVLRELESQGSDNTSWLPATRYTEITNHECSDKVEESKLSQVLGQRDTFTWKYDENAVAKSHSGKEAFDESVSKVQKDETNRNFKVQPLPVLQDEEQVQSDETEQFDLETETAVSSARPDLHDSCIPEVEMEMRKGSVDVIGGSGYVASHFVSSDENSDVHVVSRTAAEDVDSVKIKDITVDSCDSVSEQSTQISRQESEPFLLSRLILRPEEVSAAASLPPASMTARAGSPEQQVGVKQASSEASILDLQDVEYADADAEDGDDEAEREEERVKAPAEFTPQVCGNKVFILLRSWVKILDGDMLS